MSSNEFSNYLKSQFVGMCKKEDPSKQSLFLGEYLGGFLVRGSDGISNITPESLKPETLIDELNNWWESKDKNINVTEHQLLSLFDTLYLLKKYSKHIPKLDSSDIKELVNATLGGESPVLFSDLEMQRINHDVQRWDTDYSVTSKLNSSYELMVSKDSEQHQDEINKLTIEVDSLQEDRKKFNLPKPARLRLVEIMGKQNVNVATALTLLKEDPNYSE